MGVGPNPYGRSRRGFSHRKPMIAPLIVLGAPALASLLMQYVVIPAICWWIGPPWSEKAKEWRNAIVGWMLILYLGAVIWGVVAESVNSFNEQKRHAQILREVEADYQRHWASGMYRD